MTMIMIYNDGDHVEFDHLACSTHGKRQGGPSFDTFLVSFLRLKSTAINLAHHITFTANFKVRI